MKSVSIETWPYFGRFSPRIYTFIPSPALIYISIHNHYFGALIYQLYHVYCFGLLINEYIIWCGRNVTVLWLGVIVTYHVYIIINAVEYITVVKSFCLLAISLKTINDLIVATTHFFSYKKSSESQI